MRTTGRPPGGSRPGRPEPWRRGRCMFRSAAPSRPKASTCVFSGTKAAARDGALTDDIAASRLVACPLRARRQPSSREGADGLDTRALAFEPLSLRAGNSLERSRARARPYMRGHHPAPLRCPEVPTPTISLARWSGRASHRSHEIFTSDVEADLFWMKRRATIFFSVATRRGTGARTDWRWRQCTGRRRLQCGRTNWPCRTCRLQCSIARPHQAHTGLAADDRPADSSPVRHRMFCTPQARAEDVALYGDAVAVAAGDR